MAEPDIAVILINYNSSKDTLECVASIIEHTNPSVRYEMIVVDNCSETEDFQHLKKLPELANLRVERTPKNLGFGGGHMFGLQFTKAKHVLFLNNDCLFLNDVLPIMQQFMNENPACGMASAQMHDTNGNWSRCFNHFQTIWVKMFGSGIFRMLNPKGFPDRNIKYEEPIVVDYVAGAFLFADRSKFVEIGGFDPNLFLYFEEEDISLRLKEKGYSTCLVPAAKYLHHHGNSTPKSIRIQYELAISHSYLYRKHYGFVANVFFRLFYFFKHLFKGKVKLATFVLKGAPLSKSLAHDQ